MALVGDKKALAGGELALAGGKSWFAPVGSARARPADRTERRCLSHKKAVETQGKGGVLAHEAVETQGKGGVLAGSKAAEAQGKGGVLPAHRRGGW